VRAFPEFAARDAVIPVGYPCGRFLEGLIRESYAVLERYAPGAIRRYRSETELRFLVEQRIRGGDLAHAEH